MPEEELFDAAPPDHLLDNHITCGLIHEAVSTPNGDTFDRPVIERIIRDRGRCPITREPLRLGDLRPNRALQARIDEWKAEHRINLTP